MVRFLKRLLAIFRESVEGSSTQEDVAASEKISRYILTKSHFSKLNGTVKYGAFLPAPNGETSVYRTCKLSNEEIWKIGKENVSIPRKRTLYARGDTFAFVFTKKGLHVEPAPEPHPLHANVLNWSNENSERKMLAVEIANEASLVVNDS